MASDIGSMGKTVERRQKKKEIQAVAGEQAWAGEMGTEGNEC